MTTFLLVCGGGGDPWDWHRVVPLLSPHGEVLVPETPWHDASAHLPDHARALVEAAAESREVVVVAQSMGSYAASVAATRLDVRRIVLLNAMVPAPGETPGEWWSVVGQEQAAREAALAEGRDPDAEDLESTFFHDLSDDLRAEALARAEDVPMTLFGDPWPLSSWPDLPTTVVAGRDDRLFPLALQRRVARERLGVDVVEVPGGHLANLSHPEEVARVVLSR